jgi:hypothetical protein
MRRNMPLDYVDVAKLAVAGFQLCVALINAGKDVQPDPDQPAIDNIQDAPAEIISSTIKK